MVAKFGGRWVAGAIAALAAILATVAPRPAQADPCGGQYGPVQINGNTFITCSITQSPGGVSVAVPGSGPLAEELQRVLVGPSGNLLLNAFSRLLGPSAIAQTTTTSENVYTVIGPATYPFGPGPGNVNCTAPPPPQQNPLQFPSVGWPAANCNFAGYQQFFVIPGSIGIDTNFNLQTDTQLSLAGQASAANWLMGDLHTELQTAILDGDFNFVDGLIDHAGGPGSDPLLFSLASTASAQFAQLGLSDSTQPASSGPWTTWFKGDYFSTSLAATAANFGFSEQSHGGAGGVDYRIGDLLLGGALAYDHGDVTENLIGDKGTVGSWRVAGYGGWRPGPWSFTAVVAGGFHDIAADRLTMFPMPAHSSYGARTFDIAAEAAHRFPLGPATLQPVAGVIYSRLDVGRFSETGGLLDLAGQPTTIDSFKGYAGARLYQAFDLGNGMRFLPELRARVMYDLLNNGRALTAVFVDDPTLTSFTVAGIKPPRLAGLFGASVSLGFSPNCRAFVAYDAQVRGGETAHLVSGGVKLTW